MPRDDLLEITPSLLLQAYASGVFPMAEPDDDIVRWIDPLARGIIPLDGLHVSRSLRKQILRGGFHVTIDEQFEHVMRACADREETWISEELIAAYVGLHHRGYAHSVEVCDNDGALIGGLYGVRIGAAFFGESMFSRAASASKIALVWLVARLRAGGFTLLDTQFLTDHLVTMGAVEISRAEYQAHLSRAIRLHSDWRALSNAASSSDVIQRATQMS
jgi:leucyl/phenylalanyl-tRNA--protein transferase